MVRRRLLQRSFYELYCATWLPLGVCGIDPLKKLVKYASETQDPNLSSFQVGSATDLPFDENCFDVARMALVLFFIPDSITGVKEMRRAVVQGGLVAA